MSKTVRNFFAGFTLLSVELIIILILFSGSLFGFIFITNEIFSIKDTDFDKHVFETVTPFISVVNTRVMRFFTFFGSKDFLLPANIILAIYFLVVKKHRWYSIKVPVVSLGSFIIMASLKIFFGRVRPENPVFEAAKGFSYPSGHAMSAMTFYGLIIYLVWYNVDNKTLKWILVALLTIFIILIGFSRVYLRVHYASDVLAGFSTGLVWLVISLAVMHAIENYAMKKFNNESKFI